MNINNSHSRRKNKNKKAAFQLSLGFIITVVFAVVLLSLALVWLRGTIVGISDLTEQLQQQAGVKLDETFQESDVNFAIWPPDGPPFDVKVGTRLSVVAGVRNDASDSGSHDFGVSIKVMDKPTAETRLPADIKAEWVKNVPDTKPIDFGSNSKFPVVIQVPDSAKLGTYIFRIFACSDDDDDGNVPTNTECPSGTDYLWGGSAKDFVLIVTS